jgi:hypothetical protein
MPESGIPLIVTPEHVAGTPPEAQGYTGYWVGLVA